MLTTAGEALVIMLDPYRLFFLSAGAVLGLVLGILPGIGGLAGTAMLLPFTFSMDPYTAFAFLLGLGSTTATGDPIPAILFGVPGGAGSAATVLDGLPMAKRGEAGRALSAAYLSSMFGGLFGALLMAVAIPILRPLMLSFGSPEMLALAVFGLSTVAVLSGSAPLKGVTMACFGVMLAMIGSDPQTGTLRWTMDSLYLWEGMKLLPLILGMFALPELAELAITRQAISGEVKYSAREGMWQGAKDCFKHWWLIIRCSWIGSVIGAVPGMSASIIDWLAYAHAVRTEPGAKETFGKGDVRGVIASESSNNAKEGGALVPTVAFGIPGSASMAILLGAFLIHGLVPGPDMLTKNLKFTYSMVWSVALANVLGAGMCYMFSSQFAKLATLRYTLIMPAVLGIIYIGAFEGSRNWGDLYSLLIFGVMGWLMKYYRWPRPPFILGFVLGDILERYLFISIERYGIEWLIPSSWASTRIFVIILFAMAFLSLLRPVITQLSARSITKIYGAPKFMWADLFNLVIIMALAYMLWEAKDWNFKARIVPNIVGGIAISFAIFALFHNIFARGKESNGGGGGADSIKQDISGEIHMDLASDTDHVPTSLLIWRTVIFFGWMVAFMMSMALIGLIPTVPLFVIAFMRIEGPEKWRLIIPYAVFMTIFVYVMFDQMLTIPWPPTLIGSWFPGLKGAIPSM
ncbi:MAG: tripartite tricarboxylate transporter permease [Hyphomicrobiaceae bacterium]